jgi:hypothetical protein
MRIYELLLEYRRDVTQQKLAKELAVIADNENTIPEDVLEQVESMDPTRNKQFVLWLVKQLVKQQFRLEDAPRVTELLNNFISVKARLPLEQRDIGRFDFYKLDDLIDKTLTPDMEQGRDDTGLASIPDTKVLYNGPLGQLVIPLTREASCELGKKTSWCTARDDSDNMFDKYNKQGPLYVWIGKDGKRYQFHFEETQFKDSKDRNIDNDTLTYFRTRHPVLSKMFKRGEAKIISGGASAAASYAYTVVKGPWPEAEPTIMTDAHAAAKYAMSPLRKRWPAAEKTIASDPSAASFYADSVIGGRWPDAEPTIMTDARAAEKYAYTVLKRPWPEAEKVIATDAISAAAYAAHLLQKRWPAAEKTIASDPHPAVRYAIYVVGHRWPEAEPAIMTDATAAEEYAQFVIGGRWPQAESIIKTDRAAWRRYVRRFPDAKAKRVPKTAAKP